MSNETSETANLIGQATNKYRDRLENVRHEREGLLGRIDQIKSAPLPLDEVVSRVEAFVASHNLITGLESFFCPYETSNSLLTVEAIPGTNPVFVVNDMLASNPRSTVNLAGVLCSLFGETIKKTLVDAVTEESKHYPPGIPMLERPALIQDLQAKIHALEIEEEALICVAESAGIALYRRHDVNPELVLMVEEADA